MKRRTALAAFLAMIAIALVSTLSFAKRPGGGGGGPGVCECAPLDAPVICDGGKTYPNQCVASCFHATGCVPADGGGVP